MWHQHQIQLRYCHMEDDNTLSAEISDSIRISPITGDSLLVFPHHEKSAEDAEQLPQITLQQQVKVLEELVVAQ